MLARDPCVVLRSVGFSTLLIVWLPVDLDQQLSEALH